MPDPKLVVAAGDCACGCGVHSGGYAVCGRVADVLPVDVTVPGCPPSPQALLQGILQAVQRRR
jgi:Ni,Fe-hydrogenase III small subunit